MSVGRKTQAQYVNSSKAKPETMMANCEIPCIHLTNRILTVLLTKSPRTFQVHGKPVLIIFDSCEWLRMVWQRPSLNPANDVLCRLQNAVDQCSPYAGRELGRQTDYGRDSKHEVVREHQVEVTEPFQPTVVAQQVEVGNAWTTNRVEHEQWMHSKLFNIRATLQEIMAVCLTW